MVADYTLFQSELTESHDRYIMEKDQALDIFIATCHGEKERRDGEIAATDPKDTEAIKSIREDYDVKVRRAAHIQKGYESRAWVEHRREQDKLVWETGMETEKIKEMRALMEKALRG